MPVRSLPDAQAARVADRLRRWLEDNHASQRVAAETMGVSQQAVSKALQGKPIGPALAEKVAALVGEPLSELVRPQPETGPPPLTGPRLPTTSSESAPTTVEQSHGAAVGVPSGTKPLDERREQRFRERIERGISAAFRDHGDRSLSIEDASLALKFCSRIKLTASDDFVRRLAGVWLEVAKEIRRSGTFETIEGAFVVLTRMYLKLLESDDEEEDEEDLDEKVEELEGELSRAEDAIDSYKDAVVSIEEALSHLEQHAAIEPRDTLPIRRELDRVRQAVSTKYLPPRW